MPSLTFQFDKAQEAEAQRILAAVGSENLRESIDKLFARLATRAARWVVRTQLHFQNLRERSGQLKSSIEGRTERIDGDPSIRVGVFEGPALRYAGIQEYGTQGKNPESPYETIRPVNGKALAMPVGHALNAMGLPVVPGGPRAWPRPLRFVPTKLHGGMIGMLVDDTLAPKGLPSYAPHAIAQMDPAVVYLLLAKADISPHWYLRNGIETFMPEIMKALEELLRKLTGPGKDSATNATPTGD